MTDRYAEGIARGMTAADLFEREGNPRASPRVRTKPFPTVDQLKVAPEDAVLLPYQQELLGSTADVVVYEKSRRIGISWAAAAQGVLVSAADEKAGGDDTFYIGFEKEMTRGFIEDCAFWAQHFGAAAENAEEFLFIDSDPSGDKSIQAFRIRFASGFTITALTSKPRNLRSRQGFVILDEAAFMDDLAEMMKAAFALLIWGSKVWIISTHDGVDNPFNELVEACRAGKRPFKLLRTTFNDALDQGLYRRICLKKGEPWTAEGEAEWAAGIRAFYGEGAAEELDCIPAQGSGVYLTRHLIESCATGKGPVLRLKCPIGFDLRPEPERRSYVDAWLEQNVAPVLARLDRNLRHCAGGDFARSGDASLLVPLAIERDLRRTVPFVIEMRNVPYEQQRQIWFYTLDNLPRLSGVKPDSTGNGDFLGEALQQRYGLERVEKVKLSLGWYLANMAPMKAAFEDRSIEILPDADHADDLRQIVMNKGVPMVPASARFKGSDGEYRHGDFAPALCLAYAASRAEASEIDYRRVARATALDRGGVVEDDDDFRMRNGAGFARSMSIGAADEGRGGFRRNTGGAY